MSGFLLGGAVGDALGYPIEDEPLESIRRKYGPAGLTDFVDAHRPGGSISDDTQMTLFTLDGLIRAASAAGSTARPSPAPRSSTPTSAGCTPRASTGGRRAVRWRAARRTAG
ncbi:ADP-ribosylglycohydrolase family protein [Saccharopolyspora spinosporotrichia]